MNDAPAFAVVGHPNKGKSSIVATLAQDDSVRIAAQSGTTTESHAYPMTVDGEVLYTLIDTPGFQRARAALAWMKQHETTAAEHPRIVARFVEEHGRAKRDEPFYDECELLRPIVGGAGILYVVDGSTPFGAEFEPEMEVLRWTGRPSMALINPIGDADHVEPWRDALGQYFRVVRVFDAMTAEFDKRVELLRAFGQLDEAWRSPLQRAVDYLQDERDHRRDTSAREVAEMLVEMLTLSISRRLGEGDDAETAKQSLEAEYRDRLRASEKRCRQTVEQLYDHQRLRRDEDDLHLVDEDLFSETTWSIFGLTRGELLAAGALGGAVTGGVIDVATGGASLLTGAGLGAVIGGTAAWWTGRRMARVRILNQPLGGRLLVCGPSDNPNFPFVVLNRARLHHRLIADRTHAQRDALRIDQRDARSLPSDLRNRFAKAFARLRKDAGRRDAAWSHVEPLRELLIEAFEDRWAG